MTNSNHYRTVGLHPEFQNFCSGTSEGSALSASSGFLVPDYDSRGKRDREVTLVSGECHGVDGTWGVHERIRRIMAQDLRSEEDLETAIANA